MSYWSWSTKWGVCVTIEMKADPSARARDADRRGREERIGRLIEEARALLRQNQAVFDRWRAEGILPPEEPRRRV